ncbi:MAG TPA: TlyA family rRNA (cytidine-2'-O)-methyltransferase [Elusimicrobia bacterium]|nr:TlyA family rRNA (cytidine-2'-O)-methyltransferase [Elusimicrobiota bacterium]
MGKERLDKLLVTKRLVNTRNKAERLILAGEIYVNQEKISKPSKLIDPDSKIEVRKRFPYVSRGGLKLEKALSFFNIEAKDKICLDVGASTGGFTDCLLKHGAKLVYALDVGYGQLDWSLRNNPRVVNIEKTNIRYFGKHELALIIENELPRIIEHESPRISSTLNPKTIHYPLSTLNSLLPDLVTIDVSFISLEKVLPRVCELLKEKSKIIALIKPQFEAGKDKVKKGVVKDKKIQDEVIEKIKKFMQNLGLGISGIIPSPLKGPKGNTEYLIAMEK